MANLIKKMRWLLLLLAGVFLLSTGCNSKENPIVLQINKHKIPYDEYRYFFMNLKKDYDNGDSEYWIRNPEMETKLKESVLSVLKNNYVLEDTAKKYKLALSKQDKQNIKDSIANTKAEYEDDTMYQQGLAENYMTEALYERFLTMQILESKVYQYLTSEKSNEIHSDDATVLADIEKNFWRAVQILIMNQEGDNIHTNRELADDLLQRLKNGEDFTTLAAQYSEDEYSANDPNGYYFTKGERIPIFESTVASLEVNEISDVVESEYGYHIIQRLPLEDAYINENLDDLRQTYILREYYDLLAKYAAEYTVKYTDVYDTLTVETMK